MPCSTPASASAAERWSNPSPAAPSLRAIETSVAHASACSGELQFAVLVADRPARRLPAEAGSGTLKRAPPQPGRIPIRRLLMTLYLFAVAALCAAQPIVIKTGTLIDGKGGVQRNVEVVVDGPRIVRVQPAGQAKPTYDLGTMTLMPGWIDTHVHPSWHFDKNNRLVQGREAPQTAMLYAAANSLAILQAGFTTVQSVGAALDGELRDTINTGVMPGPRIITSLGSLNENSGDPEKIRERVRQFKNDGADVIKIFATKSIRDGGGMSMTKEQIDAACGEAKAQGLRAVVHAHATDGARAVILAGCTGIEHGTMLDNATLDLMRERGIYLDPNFLVLHNYLDNTPKLLGIGNYADD